MEIFGSSLEKSATAADKKEQMAQLNSSNTTFQARALLGAFHMEDDGLLRQRLFQFKNAAPPPGDTFESERMELLAEIANELEQAAEPFCRAEMGVYRGLLEHLASGKAFRAAASGFQSKPAATPLQ
jgi:hypothetical protein